MKKKYRNRAEQQDAYRQRARDRTRIQDAYEWTEKWEERYPQHSAEVRTFVRDIQHKVAEEIGYVSLDHPAAEPVDYVARTLYAFRKDTPLWICRVSEGVIVAGSHFPDVIGYDIVFATHKFNLEISSTYRELYRELLPILDQQFGNNHGRNSSEGQSAEAVKQELAGTFVLPVEPKLLGQQPVA